MLIARKCLVKNHQQQTQISLLKHSSHTKHDLSSIAFPPMPYIFNVMDLVLKIMTSKAIKEFAECLSSIQINFILRDISNSLTQNHHYWLF